jgi:hypothetical protein
MGLSSIWPIMRKIIVDAYSFNEMKALAGSSGLPVHRLAHLRQTSGPSSTTKGRLMDGIDMLFSELPEPDQHRITRFVIRDIWEQREGTRDDLSALLERVGWGITAGEPHPLELQLDIEIKSLPDEERKLLSKSLSRFHNGDFDGSVTAICSIVDSLTERIYHAEGLGNHREDSYQQHVNRAFTTQERAVVSALIAGGLSSEEAGRVWHNLRGAVNQAGYVLGAFRREISDVHGASSAPPAVVQRALDTAVFIIRSLLG